MFALPEYEHAAQWRGRVAIELLLPVVEPALRDFPVYETETVPTARVSLDDGQVIEVPPEALTQSIPLDVGAGIAGDLGALTTSLARASRELATVRVRFMKESLDRVTQATGQVVRGSGEMTWDSVMDVFEQADLRFDAAGEPVITIWPPQRRRAFDALPARTADQQSRWQALMTTKKEEADARRRDRRLR